MAAKRLGRKHGRQNPPRQNRDRRHRRDDLLQARAIPRQRVQARTAGHRDGLRGRGYQPARHRRVRQLRQRPQRGRPPRRGARDQGTALFQHVLGRRRRRGLRRGRQCRGSGCHRHGRLCGRLPVAGTGPVCPLRPRHRRTAGGRRRLLHHPLRRDVPGAALRHEGDAIHARPRHPPGGAAGDLDRLLSPRAEQSQRGDARTHVG